MASLKYLGTQCLAVGWDILVLLHEVHFSLGLIIHEFRSGSFYMMVGFQGAIMEAAGPLKGLAWESYIITFAPCIWFK